jgi:TolA-binding protein
MRKYVVVAVVVAAVGVAGGLYLLTNNADMATQHSPTNPMASTAPSAPLDLSKVDIEAEYAKGQRTFPIIAALADKRVADGDRPAAIKLLEEYVAANPKDGQGHKKLAEQYQLAGRQEDYNKELVALANAEPTEANLRLLSDVYNSSKDYVNQVEILKKIVTITEGKNPQAYVDLATMQLVINDKDGALKTAEELKAKHPTFNSYALTRIMVTVLSDKGEVDRAFQLAQDWVKTPVAVATPVSAADKTAPTPAATENADPRPNELADLCNILHYSGHADKAVALVEPHLDMLERSQDLIVAYVNANVTAGRADHAYALLQKIDEAQRMTPMLYPIYLDLALKREDVAAAETIANKLDVAVFNEEQALNIIELARANNATSVHKILITRFDTPTVLEGKPVLAAVLAIVKNDKTQDTKIETALNVELSSIQRIRLAESCARAQKTACFDAIVKQFPAIDAMTPSQVLEYAQLYIIANRPSDVIDPVGARAAVANAHADVQTAHRRLAAAAGRLDLLKPWLEANANSAPLSSVQELYYIANDHRQSEVASDVAERLYARDPSPMNRDILTGALIASGNNERAITLLREQVKESGTNDGLYLATLAKLARKDASFRKELTDYAEASLKARRGDARQQLNYAYIMINNGRKEAAIPYARAFAAEHGGEWKKMYAQLTQKPGKAGAAPVKLTREQLLEMARAKNISEANKRQIAFSLLNDGYKADAAGIFQDLARNKAPDSQEVKDLLYLWGGKLNNEQLAWVRDRAAAASPYDKARWAELINNSADDEAVMRYVSATPDALYNRPLRQKYFRILAATGSRQNYDEAMRGWVAQTTDVPALNDYAATAQAHGFREAAANGYARVLALDPNNAKALSATAALQFSKGKFSEADKNLNQYMAVQAQQPDDESNQEQAHFYKGELLRRNGDKAGSEAEFRKVVQMVTASGTRAPDALSRVYTAQFRLGQHDAAKAGFEQLLAQHPDDKSILADYMSALIEYRYISDATRIANQYDKTSPYYQKGVSLMGKSPHVASVEKLSGGREMKISFNQPIGETSPINLKDAQKMDWIENASVDYDSVSLSAKPGYVVRYIPTAQQQFAVVPSTAPAIFTFRRSTAPTGPASATALRAY